MRAGIDMARAGSGSEYAAQINPRVTTEDSFVRQVGARVSVACERTRQIAGPCEPSQVFRQPRPAKLGWAESGSEMSQKRRSLDYLEAAQFFFPGINFQNRFHQIVNMALGIDPARKG
jgi:hypothetical protein